VHASSSPPSEFRATLGALGLAQPRLAKIFGVGVRSVRRWRYGDRKVPTGVAIVCRLLAAGAVTVAQVEQAAVLVPARNGNAKGDPPAGPAPEQSALACTQPPTLADPGPTTAEKVCALTPDACRWPCGDPRDPDFHFSGASVVMAPYCESHRVRAYLAPRTGGGHGVRIGFVAHGRQPAPAHSRPSIPGAFSATGASCPPKILVDRVGDLPSSAPLPA
jgi:hypothetical protein